MDNQPKCFVPGCGRDVGVLFPKNPTVKKKWLISLGLDHLNAQIDSKSFICLDHFEENGQPSAVPKSDTSVSSSKDVPEKLTFVESTKPSTKHSSYQAGVQKKIDSALEAEALKRETMAKSKQAAEVENVKRQDKRRSKARGTYTQMCRLCMAYFSETLNGIYDKISGNITIAHMISVCLHPIQISSSDKLSKLVCARCLGSLKEYYKFHQYCLGMDAKQQELVSLEQEYLSDGQYVDSDHSDEYLHEERLSDYEEDKENKTNGHILNRHSTDQGNNSKDQIALRKSEIDLKFDRVEEELAKVLEGIGGNDVTESENVPQLEQSNLNQTKVTSTSLNKVSTTSNHNSSSLDVKGKDDAIYTEDIIIEMINDEEPPQIASSKVKLPITIKRINSSTTQKAPVKRKRNNSDHNVTMIRSDDIEEFLVLPKGIKIAVKERYHSPLGVYPCEVIKYLFDTEYLLADGYLYEYWLAKGNSRNLHCAVPKCPGLGIQLRIGHNTFSNEIELVRAHDHKSPDALDRKRQMFYNIMYSKMRQDRHFNFKLLYERFCKLDEDLVDILPLRQVIAQICKQGPIEQPPIMDCFEDFFDAVDNDEFHKIHFTDNHVQFYQDKFETDDGAKAVVFANPQVIELYSSSKLMCVDASFHIESNDFPYKLVTVLVWVHESYYPILYAFVNKKSQEIYKQIFSFLNNTLAPNFRPDEIITDYEANLYYALGETYVSSCTGGSMFYFTQNLYKKICGLKLSRELDINSNFKNIYNMLLMLPLLPVNTILDGLNNIEAQAKEFGVEELTHELFVHVRNEWIGNVTPEFFCVHRLENRINENIVAPFKKLRDLIMLSRSRNAKPTSMASIVHIIEKIIELEKFLRDVYSGPGKKTFAKDLSSSQKRIVLKAWNYIENFPKININHFFLKVLGYIKCLENQLWIWGFYRYEGDTTDELINANNFSISEVQRESTDEEHQEEISMLDGDEEIMDDTTLEEQEEEEEEELEEDVIEEFYIEDGGTVRRVGGQTSGKKSSLTKRTSSADGSSD